MQTTQTDQTAAADLSLSSAHMSKDTLLTLRVKYIWAQLFKALLA